MDYKGKQTADIPSSSVVIEHRGDYYWRKKGEGPINTSPERKIEEWRYDIYRSYEIKGRILCCLSILLVMPAMISTLFSGLRKKL